MSESVEGSGRDLSTGWLLGICSRCGEYWSKCACPQWNRYLCCGAWLEDGCECEPTHDRRTPDVEDGKPYGSGGSIYLEDE